MADLRVGIVGAGWIAGTHAATLRGLDGVRVVASADVVPGRAEYEDWRDLLARERLDAVVVCTPPDAHRDVAVACAEVEPPWHDDADGHRYRCHIRPDDLARAQRG